MMISLFDWIWIEMIAVTTAGSMAYCLVVGRQHVQRELDELKEQLEHQRTRKKFWKAKAKGNTGNAQDKDGLSTIRRSARSMSIQGLAGSERA